MTVGNLALIILLTSPFVLLAFLLIKTRKMCEYRYRYGFYFELKMWAYVSSSLSALYIIMVLLYYYKDYVLFSF